MDQEFAQTVIRFDLQLLDDNEPSVNNEVSRTLQNQEVTKEPKPGKRKKHSKEYINLRQRIMNAQSVIDLCYNKDDKIAKLRETLSETKSNLQGVCIDKEITKQENEILKRDIEKLQTRDKELEVKIKDISRKYDTANSNISQLEQLLKEQDSRIESCKIRLQKNNEMESKLVSLVKKREYPVTQIINMAEAIFSKRPLTKREKISLSKFRQLQTEQTQSSENNDDTYYEEQSNDCDDAALSDTDDLIEALAQTQVQTKEPNVISDPKINEFDCEIMSVDTGRGSSLANLNSPEYYVNSPATPASQKYVDAATSPISVECASNIRTVDKASSPIRFPDIDDAIDGIESLSKTSPKSCLKLNNSQNLDIDNTSDREIEFILNTMKLTDRLITPIPPTPVRSAKSCHENTSDYPQDESANKQNDLNTGCNVTVKQKSYHGTEDDKTLNNPTASDVIPEFVAHTTLDVLHKDLSEMSQDINNDVLQSEIEANVNNEICREQRTGGIFECIKCPDTDKKTVTKTKKLTRIEKLRNSLIPKSKIRRDLPLPRVPLPRTKKITNKSCKSKPDSAATLNNKLIYDRAVRVLSEIKSQQKSIIPKRTINRKKRFIENGQKIKDNDHPNYPNSANDKITKETTGSPDNLNDKTGSNHHNDISHPVFDNSNVVLEKCRSDRRRKSFPTEIESILSKTRKRYPSLSLDKHPVVLLSRSIADLVQAKTNTLSPEKCLERGSDSKPETVLNKKILHSPARSLDDIETNNNVSQTNEKAKHIEIPSSSETVSSDTPCKPVNYDDLDLFSDAPPAKKQKCHDFSTNYIQNPQESVLCKFIDDVGVAVSKNSKQVKVSETVVSSINAKIAESITAILELPPTKTKKAMDQMIKEIKSWELKEFVAGLMQYMMDITRKFELFNQTHAPPAPSMTKSEQVLLYVLSRLRHNWTNKDLISCVLNQIEYNLFKLNVTPELKIIESMSHFYAILCRYIDHKNRLRMFMVNAMYCMRYGAVAIVKQCISVWMQLLPLAHMGLAKNTMVSTLVYLLHFFKCNDNTNMVQDIRNTLKQKYFFLVSDWDEKNILDTFRNAIMEINDNTKEWDKKLLRLSILILAKRNGTKWCQNKLVNNILMPIITMEGASEGSKAFCIFLLGPLLKPYPEDMRVHCGIVINKLIDILEKKPSPSMTEMIYSSLICLSKHNQTRVIQALLLWRPERLTPYMEGVLRDYVKEKPLNAWRKVLSKIPLTL